MKTSLVVTLDPHNSGNMGGVAPGGPGEWFISVSRPVGSREDTILERHVNGKYVDECRVYGTGHVTAFGVLGLRNEVWIRMGNDVVRFDYRPGRVNRADTKRVEVFVPAGQDAQLSFSPTRTYAYVRYRKGFYAFFARRAVRDILAGRDRRVGALVKVYASGQWAQSFGGVRDSLFCVFGKSTDHPGAKTRVEEYSFTTGKLVGRHDITRLGNNLVPGKYEAEFAPGRYLMSKVGSGAKRRVLVYSHNLAPLIGVSPVDTTTLPEPATPVVDSPEGSTTDPTT